ncbi:MAG: hypothetical protein AAFR17_08085 [Pseudomonadota bacterium]
MRAVSALLAMIGLAACSAQEAPRDATSVEPARDVAPITPPTDRDILAWRIDQLEDRNALLRAEQLARLSLACTLAGVERVEDCLALHAGPGALSGALTGFSEISSEALAEETLIEANEKEIARLRARLDRRATSSAATARGQKPPTPPPDDPVN